MAMMERMMTWSGKVETWAEGGRLRLRFPRRILP